MTPIAQVSLQRLLSSPDSARRTLSAAAAAAFPAIARAAGQAGGGAATTSSQGGGGGDEGAMPAGFVPQQSAFSVPAARRGALTLAVRLSLLGWFAMVLPWLGGTHLGCTPRTGASTEADNVDRRQCFLCLQKPCNVE